MSTLQFMYDILQKRGPAVALGGAGVLVLGLLFGRPEMVIAGAVVALLGGVDLVMRFFGYGHSDHD